MASVTKTSTELLWAPGAVLIGTADSGVTQDTLGFTRDPMEFTLSKDEKDDNVQEFHGPIDKVITGLSAMVSGSFAQINKTTLQYGMGLAADGGKIEFGGGAQQGLDALAARVIAATRSGLPVHVYFPAAKFTGEFKLAMQRENPSNIPFKIEWLDGPSRQGYVMVGSTKESVTLATGVADRTQASPGKYISHLSLSGESAAADDLTDIEAASGSLSNGEIVRLQIATTSTPITIKHASGTIELVGSADWVMTKTQDWIDLIYDLSGTKWVELARHDE